MRIKKPFLFIGIILGIFLISFVSAVSAVQICQIYDDFSSETLNTSKWEEGFSRSGGAGWIDEHYLNVENQKYHTAQLSQADMGVELKSLRTIQTGETLEFDLSYNSGSGNHWGCIFWDETSTWSDGLSCVGNWNEVNSQPGIFGTYHIKGEYEENEINGEMTLPNGSIIPLTYLNIQAPYTFSFVTRTGHNGLVNIDYDNVKICSGVPLTLEERVSLLESKVENLTSRVNILETLVNTIKGYFWFMPNDIKKKILCGTLNQTGETTITNLGLNCEMVYRPLTNKYVCACRYP